MIVKVDVSKKIYGGSGKKDIGGGQVGDCDVIAVYDV